MSDNIPESWEIVSLSELGEWRGGGTPSKAVSAYWNGSIPWVSPKDMKTNSIVDAEDHITDEAIERSATSLVPGETVLMVTRSGILAHSFPVAVAKTSVALNQDLKALIPHEGIDGEFVAWALRRYSQNILAKCSKHGTTVHSIETARLQQFQIPLAPTNEQRRIVEKIDELFSQIEAGEQALERAQKLLERYRQSGLNAAVTGELTRKWRGRHKGEIETGEDLLKRILQARREAWEKAELAKMHGRGKPPKDDRWKQRYEEPEPPDSTDLPKLPESWAWATLEILTDGHESNGISIKGSDLPPGIPALRLDAVQDGYVDFQAKRYIPLRPERLQDYKVLSGDLLISRANGSKPFLGRAALVSNDPPICVFPDTVIRFRPVSLLGLPQWLDAIWSARIVRDQIDERAKTSAGIWKVSQNDLRAVSLPVPSLLEADVLASMINTGRAGIAVAQQGIRAVNRYSGALRRSILTAAFSGKLVPPDHSDEPALVLLGRVRTQLAAAQDARQKRPGRRGRPRKAAAPEAAPEVPFD